MKTFNSLLNEIKANDSDKFIKKVLKDIQPWIKAIGGIKIKIGSHLLYLQ
jgi:hypothetical protein